jgi:cysteine-S-conjugate beta-lyase
MIYNFDALPNRRDTESVKWNYFEADVLPMWVADMDFMSPEPVIRALQERVAHGVFGYALDYPGLRQLIVDRMEKLYQWTIQPEDIVYVPGVVTGFNMAGHAFLGAGEGVLSQVPVYMPFLDVARNVGGLYQEMELTHQVDGTYTIDWAAFENAITEQTRMFLLCNPHNPIGRVFTRAELEHMAEICTRHDLLICSDEIHCDLVYSGHQHIPLASLDKELAQRCITLMAPSKTFNIAGLSCSFAIVQNPELRRRYIQGGKGLAHGVNMLGLVAAHAAYQGGQEWLDQLLVYLEGNRDLLTGFVNQQMPGVCMASPEGTYLAWLDCRDTGIEEKLADFFHNKARVILSDGEAFGRGGKGFVRLNFGCPRSMLEEALQRMKGALEAR